MPEFSDDERADIEEPLITRIAELEAALDAERRRAERAETQVEILRSGLEHVRLYPCPVCNLNEQPRPKGLCPYQDALTTSEEEK